MTNQLSYPLESIPSCFEGIIPSSIGTVASDGTPNVTYLSVVTRVDSNHVALSRQFFKKTEENAEHNHLAQIQVIEPETGRQFQLDLEYERTETEGPNFERMRTKLDAVAAFEGMEQVFKLRGTDICKVLSCELVPCTDPESAPRRSVGIERVEAVSQQISLAEDLDEVITIALNSCVDLLGYAHAFVMLVDESGERLYTVASAGFAASGAGSEVRIGEGVIGLAAARRTAVRLTNLGRDLNYSTATRSTGPQAARALERTIPLPSIAAIQSQMVIPMLAYRKLAGVICLQSHEVGAFQADDECVVGILASHMAMAMAALGASDEQADFPILYASGKEGWAVKDMKEPRKDLTPLFELITAHIPEPEPIKKRGEQFALLATMLDADPFLGRVLTGRIESGRVSVGDNVKGMTREGVEIERGRLTKLLAFRGLKRVPVDSAEAGDIVAIAGLVESNVADTIGALDLINAIPAPPIDPPTLAITVSINDSPLAGRAGDKVQSRVIRDRLMREQESNVAIRIRETENRDAFEVAGRGELQLGVLIETMRREGFEVSISRPKVLTQQQDGQTVEPIEEAVIDVDSEYSGVVIEKMSLRKAELADMRPSGGDKTRLENAMGNNDQQTQTLNKSLQDAKAFAGLTAVEGPGVKITLTDRLRTSPLTGNYSDSLSPSDLRGNIRFRRLMAPSDTEWSQYRAGTRTWQNMAWPLDSYRSTSGTRAFPSE